MNRVLLVIGGLLVGLLALLFAAPAMVDWNRYRGIFEEEASRFLGREVRVGGKVNLRLLPVPFVRFEQVRVADTTANVGRPLFMADDFTVWLSIGGLLGGRFEASEIELRKPVLTLVLDGQGSGSWSSLAQGTRTPGQTPLSVALNAVRITNGTIAVLGAKGEPRTQFEFINGELSAQALEGPYKIAAAFALGGAPREIRLSTAKPAEDASVRFKGTVRDPASGVSYSLDGQARDVLEKLKVSGELTARLPLPAAMAGRGNAKSAGGEFDVRADLKGDTSGFTLSDLALSFEQGGRPQLASGSARVAWTPQTDVALTLKSHWLDLDRIAGGDKAGTPLQLVQTLADGLGRVLATEGRTQAIVSIDQATLGGDVASELTATLEHVNGRLAVRNLSAALPGGARLAATGTFEKRQDEQHYEGQVNLRGASMARFMGWAVRGQKAPLPGSDGPFSMVGAVSLGATEIAGRNLTMQIGRNVLTGDASWKAGKPQQIVLNLDGSEFDLTPWLEPAGAEPGQALKGLIARLTGDDKARTPGAAANTGTGPAAASDAEIRIRVDRLVAGKTMFRDAIAELRLANGNLSVPQLKLASDDGYAIEIRGDIAGLAQPGAKGTLTGLVTSERAEGVAALARVLGLPSDLVPGLESGALVAPLRLAGRLQVGLKGPETHDLAIDGTLAQSRVAGTLRLGPDAASWRERPADLALTVDGPDLPRVLARLTAATQAATGQAASSGQAGPGSTPPPTRLLLRAIGTARGGLAALGSIEADGTSAEYRGRLSLDDTGSVALDGDLVLALAELGRGLTLAGLSPRPALAGSVQGTIKVTRAAGRLQLATSQLKLAGAQAAGSLLIEPAAGGLNRITGDVKLDVASLPGFMAAMTTASAQARSGASSRSESASPWSEAPLDLSVVERVAGSRVRLEIGRLALAPGIEVSEARVDLAARPGGLDMRLTEAKALGGRADAVLAFDKAPAGVRVTAEGRLAGARLDAIGAPAGTTPAAAGGLSLSLNAAGTALTPRGLVVALAGTGELALEQARLNRLTPAGISAAAEAVLAVRGEIPPGLLRQQLEVSLRASGANLGSRKLAVTIADGALQTAPLVATSARGRITGRGVVDFDTQRLDGEWRLEPLNTPQVANLPPKPELPGVVLVYTGVLPALATLEPRLDYEALERELSVRKVEREVLELERLRLLDQERVRQETDRIEAERQQAEQRRLEALFQAASGGTAPAAGVPPTGGPTPPVPGQATPPATPIGPAQTTGQLPESGPGGALPAPAAGALAVPPSTIESKPLPQATQAPVPAPAKARGNDPFRSLRDVGP